MPDDSKIKKIIGDKLAEYDKEKGKWRKKKWLPFKHSASIRKIKKKCTDVFSNDVELLHAVLTCEPKEGHLSQDIVNDIKADSNIKEAAVFKALTNLQESKISNKKTRAAIAEHKNPDVLANGLVMLSGLGILNKKNRKALKENKKLLEAVIALKGDGFLTKEKFIKLRKNEFFRSMVATLKKANVLNDANIEKINKNPNKKKVVETLDILVNQNGLAFQVADVIGYGDIESLNAAVFLLQREKKLNDNYLNKILRDSSLCKAVTVLESVGFSSDSYLDSIFDGESFNDALLALSEACIKVKPAWTSKVVSHSKLISDLKNENLLTFENLEKLFQYSYFPAFVDYLIKAKALTKERFDLSYELAESANKEDPVNPPWGFYGCTEIFKKMENKKIILGESMIDSIVNEKRKTYFCNQSMGCLESAGILTDKNIRAVLKIQGDIEPILLDALKLFEKQKILDQKTFDFLIEKNESFLSREKIEDFKSVFPEDIDPALSRKCFDVLSRHDEKGPGWLKMLKLAAIESEANVDRLVNVTKNQIGSIKFLGEKELLTQLNFDLLLDNDDVYQVIRHLEESKQIARAKVFFEINDAQLFEKCALVFFAYKQGGLDSLEELKRLDILNAYTVDYINNDDHQRRLGLLGAFKKGGMLSEENVQKIAAAGEGLAVAVEFLAEKAFLTKENFELLSSHLHVEDVTDFLKKLNKESLLTEDNIKYVVKRKNLHEAARYFFSVFRRLSKSNIPIKPHLKKLVKKEEESLKVLVLLLKKLQKPKKFQKSKRPQKEGLMTEDFFNRMMARENLEGLKNLFEATKLLFEKEILGAKTFEKLLDAVDIERLLGGLKLLAENEILDKDTFMALSESKYFDEVLDLVRLVKEGGWVPDVSDVKDTSTLVDLAYRNGLLRAARPGWGEVTRVDLYHLYSETKPFRAIVRLACAKRNKEGASGNLASTVLCSEFVNNNVVEEDEKKRLNGGVVEALKIYTDTMSDDCLTENEFNSIYGGDYPLLQVTALIKLKAAAAGSLSEEIRIEVAAFGKEAVNLAVAIKQLCDAKISVSLHVLKAIKGHADFQVFAETLMMLDKAGVPLSEKNMKVLVGYANYGDIAKGMASLSLLGCLDDQAVDALCDIGAGLENLIQILEEFATKKDEDQIRAVAKKAMELVSAPGGDKVFVDDIYANFVEALNRLNDQHILTPDNLEIIVLYNKDLNKMAKAIVMFHQLDSLDEMMRRVFHDDISKELDNIIKLFEKFIVVDGKKKTQKNLKEDFRVVKEFFGIEAWKELFSVDAFPKFEAALEALRGADLLDLKNVKTVVSCVHVLKVLEAMVVFQEVGLLDKKSPADLCQKVMGENLDDLIHLLEVCKTGVDKKEKAKIIKDIADLIKKPEELKLFLSTKFEPDESPASGSFEDLQQKLKAFLLERKKENPVGFFNKKKRGGLARHAGPGPELIQLARVFKIEGI